MPPRAGACARLCQPVRTLTPGAARAGPSLGVARRPARRPSRPGTGGRGPADSDCPVRFRGASGRTRTPWAFGPRRSSIGRPPAGLQHAGEHARRRAPRRRSLPRVRSPERTAIHRREAPQRPRRLASSRRSPPVCSGWAFRDWLGDATPHTRSRCKADSCGRPTPRAPRHSACASCPGWATRLSALLRTGTAARPAPDPLWDGALTPTVRWR